MAAKYFSTNFFSKLLLTFLALPVCNVLVLLCLFYSVNPSYIYP